jgi:UDP-3-O-acyl-N-acetylglucosamine deacetylase
MSLQRTLSKPVLYSGKEPYGGNTVNVTIYPAGENTGIIFDTRRGVVRADLGNASQYKSAILLQERDARVLQVEHVLATLWAYGIDNAVVKPERVPSRSFRFLDFIGLGTDIEVIPNSRYRENILCKEIEEAGVEEQRAERKLLEFNGTLGTEELKLGRRKESGIAVRAVTDYPLVEIEEVEFEITPDNYRDQLSGSRPYAKHIPHSAIPRKILSAAAALLNLDFGFGHGFSPDTYFIPVRTEREWRQQEIYPAEIARHTVVDRLGAIALLPGRLNKATVTANRSGHASDIRVLNSILPQLVKV